jgi:hypothetical protein
MRLINQVSNRFSFSVAPYPPPTVTSFFLSATNFAPITAKNGIQQLEVYGSHFLVPLTVDLFYNGVVIATFGTSSGIHAEERGDGMVITFTFDFQGKAGPYGVEVAGPNGRSPRFVVNIAAP